MQLKDLCRWHCFSRHKVLCLGDSAAFQPSDLHLKSVKRGTINSRCPWGKWLFLTYLKKCVFSNIFPCIWTFREVCLLNNDVVCYEATVLLKIFAMALLFPRFHLQDFKKISLLNLIKASGYCYLETNLKHFTMNNFFVGW